MQYFGELGAGIEKRWRNNNYSEASFPQIAVDALAETASDPPLDPYELIRWLFTTTSLTVQPDQAGEFGDLTLTLYAGPRFHIDVYFWVDGTTTIHQHAFCGAFQVLEGSSLHSHYRFEPQQKINDHFVVGELVLQSVQLLEQGAIKPIQQGREYIHSLFHLDRPSVTICVRTYFTPSGAPQYNYHKPFYAIDPFFKNALLSKQTQSTSFLFSLAHPEADTLMADLLSRADFQTTIGILSQVRGFLTDAGSKGPASHAGRERFRALVDIARRRHELLGETILPVFEEAERQNDLSLRRQVVTRPEHRYFLALLLNVSERTRFLQLVALRFPDRHPLDTVTEWVAELGKIRVAGSCEPNVMGGQDIDRNYLFVLRCLFQGFSQRETRVAFEEALSGQPANNNHEDIEHLYHSIRHSTIFNGLFAGPFSTNPESR
jgi:hypothetical protein